MLCVQELIVVYTKSCVCVNDLHLHILTFITYIAAMYIYIFYTYMRPI
jgi:hypothetical protein